MNTTCITKSWLNNKSLELGIAASAIEIIIHEYINQLGNDNFPTDDYIKQLFVPKLAIIDDLDYYDNLIKLYDNIGGETIYNNEQEAIIALNKALKSFPDESVTLMPTNDGKYIVRIAQPINLLQEKEYLEILAKAPRDNNGRLLAPNGKPSNLTERQYALVRTKEFKDWFGDWENNPENASKVVDENGEPLVVYHNDRQFYKNFKQKLLDSNTDRIYFSPFREKWKNFSGNVETAVFLNIKNPRYGDIEINNIASLKDIDGLILDLDGTVEEYIIKNPNQIKSAESNIGTFSTTNDRIDRFGGQEGDKLTILEALPVKIDNNLIEEFYNNLDKNNPYHQVFKLVVDIIRANNMPINIKLDFNLQDIAIARLNGLKSVDITINPERLLKYLMTFDKKHGRGQIMRIFTHELIHSITASILETHPSWSKTRGFDAALTKFNKEINDLYNQAKEALGQERIYGLKNAKEFISEALTNPKFQNRLVLIKSKNSNKNIFQRIVDSIVNLFNTLFKKQGINISNTLLEDVLRVSLDYFNYAKEGINKDIDNFSSRNDAFGEDTKINIWAGTNENTDLSNVANRPFDLEIFEGEGKIHFNSVEQAFQYTKFRLLARNLGYEEATNKFLLSDLKLTGEDYKENVEHYITPGTKAKSVKTGGHGIAVHNSEDYLEELKLIKDHIDKILNAPNGFEAKKLGGKNGGYYISGNSGNTFLNTIWDYGEVVSDDVMKAAIKASFEQNPLALLKLLSTGNATLTHTLDKGKWGTEFPRILMEVREELRGLLQSSQKEKGEEVSDKNTFKGKEEEEKTITFASDSLKKSYNNFVGKQRELGTIIKFNPKDHSYIIDGVRNDFSVTEYRDFIRTGKRKDGKKSFWYEVSGRLGNTHDEILRDFFNGEMKDSYTNISSNQLKAFENEALKLKEELWQEFGRDAIFITDEDLLRVAATINNDGNNYLVAGTMDMIVIDNKGTVHIVDFKTKRANADKDLDEGKLKGYNQLVNLYKQLLSKKLGIDIGTTRIALFNLKYTSDESDKYTYLGNLIYYKGKKIQMARNKQGLYIYEAGTFYDTIEFEEDLSEDLFDDILPVETKLLQLKDSKDEFASDFEITDEEMEDALELIDGVSKKSSKSKRKKLTLEKVTKTKNEVQDLKDAIVALTKEIKELKEGKKEEKKETKKGSQKEEKDKISHPLIKSFEFSRDSAKKDTKSLYIFTDNTNRDSGSELIPDDSWYALKYGKGLHYPKLTTAMIRGLDNARPVSTQRYYKKGENYKLNRWKDEDIEEFKKVIDEEFNDIFEAWKSGKYDRIVVPKGDGFFNAGISDISDKRVPELKKYLESKIQELYKVLDEDIKDKKEARLKEIQQKLEYKKVELLQTQQLLQEFVDDFYKLELLEEKGNYTALYILSMDKFLTGTIDDEARVDKTIISDDIKKQKLKLITLCMPLSSLLTLDTSHVNYNLLFTLDELLKNDFLFPVGPSEKIELSDDLKLIAESMKKENKGFPYDTKTGVLQVPKFTVGYTLKEILKRNQRNLLLSTDLFTLALLRQLAKATIYKVSEIITKIHDNLNGYTYYFGREEGDPNVSKDFTKMSRIEIIQTIGLGRLIDLVKKGREAVFDIDNFNDDTPIELLEKINFINLNWDAFIDLGYDTLINLEEIALDDRNTTADLKNDVNTLFEDNDESVIQELFGSSIEHWQVGFRQVSAITSLSKQLKIVLDSFYQVDENGEIITDDLGIGIGKHLNSLEAAAKILYYTLGARSIDDMVKLLKSQIDVEPWIELLIPYIEDLYDREGNLISKADETFRSLFYSNFKKYFQKYAITFKNKKSNKVEIKVVNESSYTDSLMDSVKALENSATLGKYHLRTKDNKLNEETLKKLKELKGQLDSFAKLASAVKGSINDNKNFDLNKFHEILHLIYDLLNIDTPNNELFYKIFSVKNNIKLLAGKLGYLISTIEKNKDDINNKGKAITDIKDYKNVAEIVGKYMGLEMESVTYEAGKMYYSYVLPSYLGRLVSKLRGENLSDEEYTDVLEKEYLQYPLFKKDNKIRCYWLERLIHKPKAREMFQHITSLHYLGVEYTNKTPVEYIASMMRAYFYDDNAEWAYYRVPTLSNKPSEEYIRFIRVKNGYEQFVIDHLVDTFTYELDRVLAVRTRRDELDEDKKIKNFDTFIKKDKDGNIIKVKKGNGEKFVFLDWVLPYLDKSFKDTKEYKIAKKQAKKGDEKALKLLENMQEFSDLINRKLDDKMSNENADNANLLTLFKEIAKVSLESKYQEARQYWEREGFLTKKTVEKNGRKVETTEIFGFNNKDSITDESLREFFFNDMLAAINILLLTVGDTAYYKDTEDLQKRLALIHAPGMQANIYARDSEGNRYSDGYERTMYIADDVVKSELISNLKIAMNNILSEYDKESKQYTILKNQFKFVLDTAEEINVADALGFSCLTSHRKKLALFGLWTDRMEEAYLLLTEPELFEDASLTDILDVLLQPIKPFVYTLIAKNGYNESLSKLKVGILNKNSEYVIALVDAILKKGNQPNKLRAIYQFMEDSQKNGKGIDTILFESTVKAGLTGVINLNGNMSEEEVYRVLLNHLYNTDGTYNTDYVHEIPFEDYIIQQNVPSHFRDHELAHGSQNRILTVADLQDKDKDGNNNYITIDGKNVTVAQAKKDYFKAIADNILLSVDRVVKRFKLDSFDLRQRNIALSRILKDAILKDSRFGADLYWACDTNEYGEFNIPLSDPIHSNRILQLLNSIIKNAINKQEIAGGPVVQATSWGLSDDLHIRFRAYNGKILLTEEEFYTENYPTDYKTGNYLPKEDYESYEKYVEDNLESVAYFECYVPIQDKNIALDFTRKDEEGNEYIDVEEMKKANPKLLEMIGYRIPTESKYSMVPIKVKGFVNNMSGELIMMPKEITWLSGSDFDKI